VATTTVAVAKRQAATAVYRQLKRKNIASQCFRNWSYFSQEVSNSPGISWRKTVL